jgi:hypothetical protein
MGNEHEKPGSGRTDKAALRRAVNSLVDSALRKAAAGESGDPFDYVKLENLRPEEQESLIARSKREVARRLREEAERKARNKGSGGGRQP